MTIAEYKALTEEHARTLQRALDLLYNAETREDPRICEDAYYSARAILTQEVALAKRISEIALNFK